MKLFLGIDGGQSSTTALIGDASGRVLGEGRAGPCNHVGESERRAKFVAAVGTSVREAATQAGIDNATFEVACAGFSGGAQDKVALTRELIPAKQYHITHDAEIALAGAANGGAGILVIAGTGSIAYGRNEAQQSARAGGWGYIFGDEGGAFDIARQALRAALRWEEKWGPPTALHEALLSATQATSANDLVHRCYTTDYPRERVAQWARLVDGCATEGDAVALGILEQAAQHLASLAAAVRPQLFGQRAADVFPIGGVFQSRRLRAHFDMLIEWSGARATNPLASPARGALHEALRIWDGRIWNGGNS
jgi:N-acetylglucosamine kinase-like BadF-type ATPase